MAIVGIRVRLAVATFVIALSGSALSQSPAHAAEAAMAGSAACTQIDVLNGAVVSGPTSLSGLQTTETGRSSTNRLVEVEVAGLMRASALSSVVSTAAVEGGKRVTSSAKLLGLTLLGGAISVDAVTTTSSVSSAGGVASFRGGSDVVGLTVGGNKIPVRVSPNTTVTIPGVAKVVINKVEGTRTSDAAASVRAASLEVTLLKPVANAPAGAVIRVTPTSAAIGPPSPSVGPALGGYGHVVKASANVGNVVKVLAGPVAAQYMPIGGTAGQEVSNQTLGVNLPQLRAGVVSSTVAGTRKASGSSGTIAAQAANLNLLNGLIVADLVRSSATASRVSDTTATSASGSSRLVGLKIAGLAVPVQVPPNTRIAIPGIASVVVNEQTRTSNGIEVRALHVKLLRAVSNLPAGAEVEVSTAVMAVGPR